MRQIVPAPAVPLGGRYVSLDALRAALDAVEWAPLRLVSGRGERPASPRLPQALLLHLAQHAREQASAAGDAATSAASIAHTATRADLSRLEALLGAERAIVAEILDALQRAGLVDDAIGGPGIGAGPAVRLTPAVLGADPRCTALDWRTIATVTAGSPSAWVAAHALAERLDPYDWTPVARGGLEQALGCGVSGVRAALERLVSAELLERREQRGGVSVYRFTDLAWGRGRGAAPVPVPMLPAHAVPSDTGRSVAPVRPSTPPPVTPPPLAHGGTQPVVGPTPGGGVRLVIGGVELELPAGCRAQVAIGPDGRPTISLVGPGTNA